MSFYNGLDFELEPDSGVFLDEPFSLSAQESVPVASETEEPLVLDTEEKKEHKTLNPLSETDQYANERMYAQFNKDEGFARAHASERSDPTKCFA